MIAITQGGSPLLPLAMVTSGQQADFAKPESK